MADVIAIKGDKLVSAHFEGEDVAYIFKEGNSSTEIDIEDVDAKLRQAIEELLKEVGGGKA